jgi:hypothetical protein
MVKEKNMTKHLDFLPFPIDTLGCDQKALSVVHMSRSVRRVHVVKYSNWMIYKEVVRVLIYMVHVSRSLTSRIGNEVTVFLYGSVFLVTHTQSHRKVHEVTLLQR